MTKKRERTQVIYDILISIRDSNNLIKPTRLLYSSNLSPQMFKDYINELETKELISKELKNKRNYFSLSQKGFKFIEKYNIFIEFIENIGL